MAGIGSGVFSFARTETQAPGTDRDAKKPG
jgi:hypothetical protein